jgi:hypothetical protein
MHISSVPANMTGHKLAIYSIPFLLVICLGCSQQSKEEYKQAGQSLKTAAQATGKALKTDAKVAGKATEKAVDKAKTSAKTVKDKKDKHDDKH